MSADRKYMYCKGIVRSQGSRTRSNLVVAVEWLDENQQALNRDWKRIEMQLGGQRAPLFPDTMKPFRVKVPLDRRVKSVKAYAFSGNKWGTRRIFSIQAGSGPVAAQQQIDGFHTHHNFLILI